MDTAGKTRKCKERCKQCVTSHTKKKPLDVRAFSFCKFKKKILPFSLFRAAAQFFFYVFRKVLVFIIQTLYAKDILPIM